MSYINLHCNLDFSVILCITNRKETLFQYYSMKTHKFFLVYVWKFLSHHMKINHFATLFLVDILQSRMSTPENARSLMILMTY
jgi:hypothetical protein